MANYATLKAAIEAAIYENHDNEITGQDLQNTLIAMVNSLGAGYQFVGIATPITNPGTPDYNVFYLASQAGIYANFGSLVVADGEVAILKYNGTWTKEVTGAAIAAKLSQLAQEVTAKDNRLFFEIGDAISYTIHHLEYQPFIIKQGEQFSVKNNGTKTAVLYLRTAIGVSSGQQSFNVASGATALITAGADYAYLYLYNTAFPSESWPLVITPVTGIKSDISELSGKVTSISSHIVQVDSVNLFNKDSALVKIGYYNNTGSFVSANHYAVTGPILLKAGVTYKAPYQSGLGTSNKTIAIVDENNVPTGKLDGTISGGYITVTPSADTLTSWNCGYGGIGTMMVCKSADYPNEYTPYYSYVKLRDIVITDVPSKLQGKSVIFTGDSICAGASDSAGNSGYASRIGKKNSMIWQNLAVSGGTIIDKDLVSSSFTISDTNFGSGADYIILEGGTNDADRIGSILETPLPALFGSYDETDYVTAFDNQTFCSAVEKLLQTVVSSFPSARVGFIIAPKMGVVSTGYTKETNNRRAYFETIIKICHKWGVPVLNLWDECTMNPKIASHYTSGQDYLYADGQHPTANGYELMTPIVEAWMETL